MEPQVNTSQYSIVVVGAMNPAIHHPHRYGPLTLLSADEVQHALRGGALVVVPQVAQFHAARLQIQCTPANWQINTSDQQQRGRIVDIAAMTFQRLGETPISAYGLNARFEVTTGSQHAIQVLGAQFSNGPVDLSFQGSLPDFESLAISYGMPHIAMEGQPDVQRQLKCSIGRSTHARDAIVVAFNMHHAITMSPEFSRFDLDRLLLASTVAFEMEDALLRRILDVLTKE